MHSFATVAVGDIDADLEAEMFGLFAAYYDCVDRDRFGGDLREKHFVLLMRGGQGQVLGFTTLRIDRQVFGGQPVRAAFSGDTIIHHTLWGRTDLHAAWLRLMGRVKAEQPAVPLYWFLVVMSHRTYRHLQVYAYDYFPRHDPDPATEPQLRRIAHGLAADRFGAAFDADGGVIRFPQSLGQLKRDWTEVPERLADRPEIRFFLERNPDYREGVEMVCLAELSVANLKPFVRQFFEEGLTAADPQPVT
ncbi:hypothetical protein [Falsiroseomonas selenitidurans]|uniref:GNAT family N-acetyltransferase n=1 Tax=Falsiroseomonas selenitidurans TaxID=2716335 RepID=A0ABX1E1P8_9PROT|nr:hypothetical protein [Falsiroseomonas selenitidurans]NKC31070.1 hypothetical protein [Falsiroseomonas selenitidurans]